MSYNSIEEIFEEMEIPCPKSVLPRIPGYNNLPSPIAHNHLVGADALRVGQTVILPGCASVWKMAKVVSQEGDTLILRRPYMGEGCTRVLCEVWSESVLDSHRRFLVVE